MSRSCTRRGQTEPIAAIVAVAAIALSIGIYAAYVTGALPGSSDRAVEEPAIDRVWYELETGGIYEHDPGTSLAALVDARAIPEGYNVYVSVTAFDPDGPDVDEEGYFGTDGYPMWLTNAEAEALPPPETSIAERPIPVEVSPGAVRGGTLRVEVWS